MNGQEDKTKFEEVQQHAREARWGADRSSLQLHGGFHTHSRKFGQRGET